MAKVTITVTVFNGLPPVSIQVRLYKDGQLQQEFGKSTSFSHPFNLSAGSYCVSIGGMNPAGGSTDFEISRENIHVHPPDDSPISKSGNSYNVNFNFQVLV